MSAWAIRTFVYGNIGLLGYLYYLPGVVFAPIALALSLYHLLKRGKPDKVLALLVVTLAAGPLMGARVSPGLSDDAREVRIVTINAQSYTTDLASLSARLAAQDADVIFLQEVWTNLALARIKKGLPGYTFFPSRCETEYSEVGVYIATRLPVRRPGEALSGAILLPVRLKNDEITLVCLHGRKSHGFGLASLMNTIDMQQTQVKEVEAAIADSRRAILAGDFNAPPSAPSVRYVSCSMVDAFSASGNGYGFTFPEGHPILRIDHVFCKGLRPLSCWTIEAGTDHLAVVADLKMP